MSFGGWDLETSRLVSETSVKLALKMTLYRYSTRERLTYPTKVPSLSRKNERRSEACARRGYLWARQVQRIYARRKSTDWKVRRWTWTRKGSQTFLKAFVQESPAFYTQLSLHICTSTPRSNIRTRRSVHIRHVTITYDIIARKYKTTKLKSAK